MHPYMVYTKFKKIHTNENATHVLTFLFSPSLWDYFSLVYILQKKKQNIYNISIHMALAI